MSTPQIEQDVVRWALNTGNLQPGDGKPVNHVKMTLLGSPNAGNYEVLTRVSVLSAISCIRLKK